jgi:hypothetical protein
LTTLMLTVILLKARSLSLQRNSKCFKTFSRTES